MVEIIKMSKLFGNYIFAGATFFLIGIIGYGIAMHNQDYAISVYNDYIMRQVNPINEFSDIAKCAILFISNSIIGLTMILTGFVGAKLFKTSILPILTIMYNGFVLGVMFFMIGTRLPATAIALSLIPHGIFELSALFLCCAGGLYVAETMIGNPDLTVYTKKPLIDNSNIPLLIALKTYLCVMLPMFLVAAVVEIFISTQILKYMVGQ